MEEKFGILTKKYMVSELAEKISKTPSFVITNYKGTASGEMEELRKALHRVSAGYVVVKNSILKRAFDRAGIKDVDSHIKGEVGISLMSEDIVAAAKALVDFSKSKKSFKLRCAYLEGRLAAPEKIKHLATLPPREVLLAMVLTYMKGPITGFAGVLSGLLRSLVIAISEIKKKKG